MTDEFDKFIYNIIGESKCKGVTQRSLSGKPEYSFKQCLSNPYSSGFKEVMYGDRTGTFDYRKCYKTKKPRKGTQADMECKLYWERIRRKRFKFLKKQLKLKLKKRRMN